MESNSVYNHTSDKQNRTTAQRESDLFITSLIDDSKSLPINHKNFREKKNNQLVKEREHLH